jgi:hypothetical protein
MDIYFFWVHIDYGVFALALFSKELKTIDWPMRVHELATSTY